MSEHALLESLDRAVARSLDHPAIAGRIRRVRERLTSDAGLQLAWEPIPLAVYGALDPALRSSWVFLLRAGATTGAERHPNSHQRVMSVGGSADMQTWDGRRWQSHRLARSPSGGLDSRWLSIPVNTWHRPVVDPGLDWLVISFHTATADQLIEELARDDQHPDDGLKHSTVYAGRDAR